MIINTDEIKKLICDSGIPTTKLEMGTGVSRVTISNLRSGRADWNKVWLSTLERFQEYIDENKGAIKMMNENILKLNELSELQELAEDGVLVMLPNDVADYLKENADTDEMSYRDYVAGFVEDYSNSLEVTIDDIKINGEGIMILDDSNLDAVYSLDWLGKNSNFKELFNDSVKAEELVEQIYDTYFN